MEKIFEINVKKCFTLNQINDLLPVIIKMTETAQVEIKQNMNQFEALREKKGERAQELEMNISDIIDRWHCKIEKLGGMPKGLWLADFDFGLGYYCWRYPENKIQFWHGYQDGFSGRKPVEPVLTC